MSAYKKSPDSSSVARKGQYQLPAVIRFGFDKEFHSNQMKISPDGTVARKIDPELVYANGVVYSDRPAKGLCEFEIEVISYGTGWSGNFKLGLMSHKTSDRRIKEKIPRYTPESQNHCVWCASKLHDRITSMTEIPYGDRTLDELREGDRLGMQITPQGTLQYFLNGVPQGIGATDLHKPGHDLYLAVDHYANCKATKITRAVMRVEFTLQELCLDQVASFLYNKEHIDKLPLPHYMQEILKDYNYPGKNSKKNSQHTTSYTTNNAIIKDNDRNNNDFS